MTSQLDTHVVLLTPEGRGAIASLLVAGPRATEIVGELFQPLGARPFGDQPLARILFGRFLLSADSAEEVVVCRRCAQRVEIHCHGGAVAARAMIDSLEQRGCRETSWREWARQTALDPIASAAEIALAAAPTERTAAILWDQRSGALRRALDEIAGCIAASRTDDAARLVGELLARAPLGRHLVEPWRVVLAGRSNVGKSSLINALVGYERSIVHPTPGTTRDIVTASTALAGWPVELCDTAGLRASAGAIESAGIELAQKRMATADLVVLVFDASTSWSDNEQTLVRDWPGALFVFNKCDLLAPDGRPDEPIGGCQTSAKRGDGIAELGAEIARRLVPAPPTRGQAVPLAARQVAALESIREQLAAGRLSAAGELLARSENWGDESC